MSDVSSNASSPVLRFAARGDGLTEDGRHIAGAVPGDRVAADGTIEAGPNRQTPLCRHFGDCGGCQLQHATDALLADFAQARITEPLARVGIVAKQVMATHVSPAGARRRAALRATRTGGEVRLGFNAQAEHRIVDLHECPVMHPALQALLPPLRELLAPHLAERSAISVTLTLTDGGVDLLLGNLQANSVPLIDGLAEFAHRHALARLSVDGPLGVETVVARADPSLAMAGVAVTLPPAAFLQATADGEAALVSAMQSVAGRSKRVADLFAGCGTFSFPLAAKARVEAIDGTGAAIRALETAARRAEARIGTQHRDLFRKPLSADELNAFDAVVIDPPRAGAQAQCANLALSRVPVVAAVSCNPATFARDAETLARGGYTLHRLWPVAQFRWSTHVELVAEFRR